jgi:hypothetical protein
MGNLSKSYLKEKFLSTKGYKRNSPDVNNPYNVIPSNQITMRGVDFPVLGVDNMGNRRLMEPGNDYTFPGNYVTEFPMRNMGSKRFGQVGMQTSIYGRTNPANNSYVKPLNSVPLGLSKNITNIPYTKPVSQKPDPRNAMFLQSANIMPTTEAEKEITRIGNSFKNYENSQGVPKFTDNYYQTNPTQDNLRTEFHRKSDVDLGYTKLAREEAARQERLRQSGVIRETTDADREAQNRRDYTLLGRAQSLGRGDFNPLTVIAGAADYLNPAFYYYTAKDLGRGLGQVGEGVYNLDAGQLGSGLFQSGLSALNLVPAAANVNKVANTVYRGIPKIALNKTAAQAERTAGVDWLRKWYSQPDIKSRFNQQIYNSKTADDAVSSIYKKNLVTGETQNSRFINIDKSPMNNLAAIEAKANYGELKYGFKNDPIVSLKYGQDIPATHKNYLGVNAGFGSYGGYTNVYPEHPAFFYTKFNPKATWKPSVKGTTVHEGTHWLTSGDQGLSDAAKSMFREPFSLSKRVTKHDKYLTKPTEIHARLNELRAQYNLGPTVERSQVDKIVSDGLKGKTTVDKRFFELLKDNQSFTDLFNTAMSVSVPLGVGLGAGYMLKNQQPTERTYQTGGQKSPVILPQLDYDLTQAPKQGNFLLSDIDRPFYIDDYGDKRSEFRIGINVDGRETLIPTVVNGQQLNDNQAIDRYYQTGLHMGQYNTPEESDYASRLRTMKYNMLEDPVRFGTNYQMGGTIGIPRVNGQVVSSQPQLLTSVRRTRGPITKNNKGDVKTMPKKAVKNILKNIR